jgi:anti-sigma-K factor RskA
MNYGENEKIMRMLKDVYRREEASPGFKARLRDRLAAEAGAVTTARRPFWQRPPVWIPAVAGAAVVLILVIALVIVPAISPQKAAHLGTLQVRVTDAKDKPVVTAINVTFDNITVHRAGDGDSEGEWIVVSENLNKTVDLLQLTGIGDLLGEDEIQAGHYTQIRVGVVRVEVTVDGSTEKVALEPAAGAEMSSGYLKFVSSFSVRVDETTVVTIDFDVSADKSVVFAGGKWIFKPTIKLDITSPGQ